MQTYIDGESALIGLTRNPPDSGSCGYKDAENGWRRIAKKLEKENADSYNFSNFKEMMKSMSYLV